MAALAFAAVLTAPVPSFAAGSSPAPESAGKRKDVTSCLACHAPEAWRMWAYFDGVSMKAEVMQLRLDNEAVVARFDWATIRIVNGVEQDDVELALRAIRKGHEVRATFVEGEDGVRVVTEILVKPPLKIAPGKLIGTEDVEGLLAGKDRFTLIDARPPEAFLEGSIPGAVNVPFTPSRNHGDRLPKDRNERVVFFCGGVISALGNASAIEAEKLGYTHVRIYQEGLPGWTRRHPLALSPRSLKEGWLDRDIPFILLDVRPDGSVATGGFIPGAVAMTETAFGEALGSFPPKALNPPIVVYDARGEGTAARVAKRLLDAGYPAPRVLTGGYAAWIAGKLPTGSGTPATKVSYVPKAKAGSMSGAEFESFAAAIPPGDVLIDVREKEEVASGGIVRGAVNIPCERIVERLAEIPKDKEVVLYCSTGVRSEMGYHILKERGYRARFVDGAVTTRPGGGFTVSTPDPT